MPTGYSALVAQVIQVHCSRFALKRNAIRKALEGFSDAFSEKNYMLIICSVAEPVLLGSSAANLK